MTKPNLLFLFLICITSACVSTMKIPAKYNNVKISSKDYYVNRAGDTIFENNRVGRSRIMTERKIFSIASKYYGNGDIHIAASKNGYFKRIRKGYNYPEATSNSWAILRIAGKIAVYEGVSTGMNKLYKEYTITASRNLYLQKNDTSSFVDFNFENLAEMISDNAGAMSYLNKMQPTNSKHIRAPWGAKNKYIYAAINAYNSK